MTTTSNFPTKNNLFSAMQKGKSTNNWDIVCSYSEDKINALLEQRYDQKELTEKIAFSISVKDSRKNDHTVKYNLVCGTPLLKFAESGDFTCKLAFPLSKFSYTIDKQTPIVLDGKYSLTVSAPLANLNVDSKKVQSGNSVVEFKKPNQKYSIFLHFKSKADTKFTLIPSLPDLKNMTSHKDYFSLELQNHFQDNVKEIEYVLTTVSNTKSSKGDIVISPKSFIFAIAKHKDTHTGVLSIYIQTKNSGNKQGDKQPSFQPGDKQTYPIPKGYSASLIFSRSFMDKVYLGTQLKKQGFTNIVPQEKAKEQLSIQACYDTKKSISSNKLSKSGFMNKVSMDTVTIDFATHPYVFEFSLNQLKISLSLSKTTNWTQTVYIPSFLPWPLPSTIKSHRHGTVTVGLSLSKTFKYSSIAKATDKKLLGMNFAVNADDYGYKISVHNASCGGNLESDIKSALKSHIGKVLPAISFNFDSLSYFSATNLLFPGKQILEIDKAEGIHVPTDMILLGNVKN